MRKRSSLGALALLIWQATGGRILWVVLLGLVTGLTEGISITLLIPIVAAVSPETASQAASIPIVGSSLVSSGISLPGLLAIFVGLISFQAALTFSKNLYAMRLIQSLSDQMKRSLMTNMAAARWDAIAKKRFSDVNQVLTSGISRCIIASSTLVAIIQASILILIYICLAAIVSWKMALFAVFVGALLFALMFPLRRRATAYGREITDLFEQQSHVTLDFLGGLRFAKSFVAEGRFLASFDGYLKIIRTQTFRYFFQSSIGTAIFQIGTAVFAASFVYVAIRIADIALGELAVLLVIFARLAPRFGSIQEQSQQLLSNAPAYFQYRDSVKYFEDAREPAGSGKGSAITLSKEISFTNITMRFSPTDEPCLIGVTARIPRGRITALVGPSGSGKSTLADIISGLFSPTEGTLAVDGTVISNANLRAWRSRVAIVPQEAFLFELSIRENLTLAQPSATDAAIWKALERAEIAEFVRSLPDGLETQVGNRGTRFSGGERQRIAIARALMPNPELLVLDEATSALDIVNQNKIASLVESLRQDGRTILLITHQSSLADIADERIEIDQGRLTRTTSGVSA